MRVFRPVNPEISYPSERRKLKEVASDKARAVAHYSNMAEQARVEPVEDLGGYFEGDLEHILAHAVLSGEIDATAMYEALGQQEEAATLTTLPGPFVFE